MKFKELKDKVLQFANKYLYEWLIKKIFGKAIGGVQGWIATLVFDHAWKKYLKPGLQWVMRQGQVAVQKLENDKKLEELQDAKTEEEFDSRSDNLP